MSAHATGRRVAAGLSAEERGGWEKEKWETASEKEEKKRGEGRREGRGGRGGRREDWRGQDGGGRCAQRRL